MMRRPVSFVGKGVLGGKSTETGRHSQKVLQMHGIVVWPDKKNPGEVLGENQFFFHMEEYFPQG